ncbi:unnamed protein product [Effrenium voratum]|uniref:Uncharacterized protein n=1 Tax=Effrenium voratum TaxID=2562239 RepID=A0AA36I5I9_9DINO|nr:unnamed protein product [Effrenium voratum]CAJ1442067.1 unnamed protein product [Effrenium voratum]
MSFDPQVLEACGKRCGVKVLYVDLVTVQFEETEVDPGALEDAKSAGPKYGPSKKAYVCVGQSSICLLSSSLSSKEKDGQIEYAWIKTLLIDTSSRTKLVVTLQDTRPKGSSFTVESDMRDQLVSLISANFVADSLHRLGTLQSLPTEKYDLGTSPAPNCIAPPNGFKCVTFQNYSFFIRKDFKDVANAVSKAQTGHFSIPVGKLTGERSWFGGRQGHGELLVNVVDPMPITELRRMGREHVRWVALECKQALLKSWNTLVVHNRPYMKKMNLANDLALWSCWELVIEDEDFHWAIIVLRRMYLPPLLDTVQDFILALKCPAPAPQDRLLQEIEFIADSFSPPQNPSLNPDIIQAKLDSLIFDDEAYTWIYNRFWLWPAGQRNLDKYATIFVKGVVKSLHNEHVLSSLEILEEIEKKTSEVCDSRAEVDLDPLQVFKILSHPGEGIPRNTSNVECLHAWQERVARYLAHQLDGGILGPKMTLGHLVQGVHNGHVPQETARVFENILASLLHLRSVDLRLPWELKVITSQMLGLGLLSKHVRTEDGPQGVQCMFHDNVMQVLLESGYMRTELEDEDAGKGCMSMEYSYLLANLLSCDASSTNLKACVCRLIIADKDVGVKGQSAVLASGLMQLMENGSSFLMTYASAAMVNLCQSQEVVRSHLIHNEVIPTCKRNIRSKDTELMLYSFMLLVQLTRRSNHRAALEKFGILQLCCDVLQNIYEQVDSRWRVIAEVCTVIGHCCTEEGPLKLASENKVNKYLLKIMAAVLPPGGLPERSIRVLSKALPAMQNLCSREKHRDEVCDSPVLAKLVEALARKDNLEHQDFASNVIKMLTVLCLSRRTCERLKVAGWGKTYEALITSDLASQDVIRERIQSIQNSVALKK